ncbi:MAG: G-D-S-L family lipolytic protein, partial [Gammaproteobacteria bacterium]|nr:G-D-S-L family lipolytic protein [Gammaproteobacteria bacterium]
ADGALYRHGQENSYGAILAQQFALVGGGAFSQPLMPVEGTGSLHIGPSPVITDDRYYLFPTVNPEEPLAPARLSDPDNGDPSQVVSTDILTPLTGPFNNMGVPGAKLYHVALPDTPLPGYGNPAGLGTTANPYFVRFASTTAASMLGDAAFSQTPSFFVLWLGNNDILSYATGGGVGADQTGNSDVTTYGAEDITDPGFFASGGSGNATGLPSYAQIAGALASGGAKGVLVNIPNVSSIPYFTTVPYNPVVLTDQLLEVDPLNTAYGTYNGGLAAAVSLFLISPEEAAQRAINFAIGQNALVIEDESLTDLSATAVPLPSIRQATANDLIVLPSASKIGTEAVTGNPATKWGVGVALEDIDVLTETEIGQVETARLAYNATIAGIAAGNPNLLLYDAAALLDEVSTTGVFYGTGGITSTYATGGGFSLDGVHPTARGYAVIANGIIDTINDGFGANIPPVDPNQYTTVFIQ